MAVSLQQQPGIWERRKKPFRELRRNLALFSMLLPGLAFLLIFNYLPMGGIIIAFKQFTSSGGRGASGLRRLVEEEQAQISWRSVAKGQGRIGPCPFRLGGRRLSGVSGRRRDSRERA